MMTLMKRMTWPLIVLAMVACLLLIAPVTAMTYNPVINDITPAFGIADGHTIPIVITCDDLSKYSHEGSMGVFLGRLGEHNEDSFSLDIPVVVSSWDDTTIHGTFTLPSGTATGPYSVLLRYVSPGVVRPQQIAFRFYAFTVLATAPVSAGFYAFGHVGQAPYSVRFQDLSTGSPTAWHWNFGDGTTSVEQNPTHIYTSNGAYTVSLSAYTPYEIDTTTQYRCIIVNTVPVANFTANATAGRTPFAVQFTDQSTGATGYQWQFGDGGTSTDQNPVHTYTQPGTYTVTQVASRADYGSVFLQKPGYITVTDPPTVGFSSNVTAGLSPLAVQFNESTTGSVQYFYWQFGDRGTSFDRNPVHRYDTAGRYTVSLYAIGSNGYQVKTVENYINVTAPVTPTPTPTAPVTTIVTPTPTEQYQPVANFTVTPQGGSGSMGILVTDTSVNATSVRYDLGDGTTTTYPNFRYTYWKAGTYTIKQIATSAVGSTNTIRSVTVPAVVDIKKIT